MRRCILVALWAGSCAITYGQDPELQVLLPGAIAETELPTAFPASMAQRVDFNQRFEADPPAPDQNVWQELFQFFQDNDPDKDLLGSGTDKPTEDTPTLIDPMAGQMRAAEPGADEAAMDASDLHAEPTLADAVPSLEALLPLFDSIPIEPTDFGTRMEMRELSPRVRWQAGILLNSEAVALVVERTSLTLVANGVYQLEFSGTLGQVHRLCPREPYTGQPIIGIGTAFIIGEQTMVTADHVLGSALDRYAIVFGHEITNRNSGATEVFITADRVYFPRRVLNRYDHRDALIFEVDRPLKRAALAPAMTATIRPGDHVYMIGYPLGLPKKVTLNATVMNTAGSLDFHTNLDAFQGNSGSPVFSMTDHRLLGLLVAGDPDLAWNGTCNESIPCIIPRCRGERITRIDAILEIRP